jgi:Glyoxalase-like domain
MTAAMAYEFQVTVDCADPHTLADWWAETLGWQVQPVDEAFIRRMISAGHAADSDTKLHQGTLVWKDGAAICHPEGTRRAPRVLFQLVPEAKAVKNRLHLDVRIGADDAESVVAGLVARGATVLHTGQQGPHTWVTLTDPEGNEFCVSRSAGA